ncbi:la related protein 7 [Choristoneura fumiferana]|uniref:la related protein 7 n=1 Tax=Choristoneura fumiferana TaxID=7141 RepID=UPI003D15A52E
MSETVTAAATDDATKHENQGRKRVRHRKKLLYDKILKQMEFYFSDANLTKDRFLGDLVKNDPFVAIEVFLKFNKIRALTQDVVDIAKAMKFSTILELSEDKQKIRRKTPVLPYDADLRTIYVESIPVSASREWLARVFSDYGNVAYISLPKFKNSQKIKGYGFIEFNKPEDAQKCLMAFTEMGCKLPTCMPPEDLSSIKMFSVDDTEETENKPKDEEEPPKKKSKKNKDKRPKNLEFKVGHDSDSEKKDTPTEENKSLATPTDETRTTDAESKDELTSQDESKDPNTPRKIKTKRKKTKSKPKPALSTNEAPKGALWGLQVLPKTEWKALRNKYLNLQRKYMKELKMNLYNNTKSYLAIPDPATPSMEAETALNQGKAVSGKTVVPLEKIPGVFVREVLPEPCLDIRHTKRTVRSNIHALHVEAKEGQSEIIIRFDSAKAADEYCGNSSNRATILCGAEEEEQWRRAEAARAPGRLRGRDRLRARVPSAASALAPAEPQPTHTHIRFDD